MTTNNVEILNNLAQKAWQREQQRLKRELMAFAVEEDDTDPALAWSTEVLSPPSGGEAGEDLASLVREG